MSSDLGGETVLVCRAGTSLCALPVVHVFETMRALPVVPIPGAPPFVRGLARIRGTPTPVVDVATFLGGAPRDSAIRFVTVKAGGRQVALAFEEVVGVRWLSAEASASLPPLLRNAGDAAISAVSALDSELLLVLDATRIVPEAVTRTLEAGAAW